MMSDAAAVTPQPIEAVLGYAFQNKALLREALTHASVARQADGFRRSNQRLEFLGDAVLQLVLTHVLYEQCGEADEGALTRMRAQLVSTTALAVQSRRLHLGEYLEMDVGEVNNGGRRRDSILADAFEAVLGAIYLDGGLPACEGFISRHFAEEIVFVQGAVSQGAANPKGRLQEILQAINQETPDYQVVAASGPDHARQFEVAVHWSGLELGRGMGHSKKEATSAAARRALELKRFETLPGA